MPPLGIAPAKLWEGYEIGFVLVPAKVQVRVSIASQLLAGAKDFGHQLYPKHLARVSFASAILELP